MNKKINSICGVLLSSMLIAGCGGGGGDSASIDTPPIIASSAVTVDNADTVAALAYAATSDVGSQSELASDLVVGVSVTPQRVTLVDTSLALLYKKSDNVEDLVVGATITENCTGGGSVMVTDTSTSVSITANNCIEDGMRMNGELSLTLSNVSGTIGPNSAWGATMAIVYQGLSIQYEGASIWINGGMTLGYSQINAQVSSASVSGQSLNLVLSENGSTVLNSLLEPFSFSFGRNNSTYTETGNFTYSASGSAIGSTPVSYSVTNNAAFAGNVGYHPYQGSLTVSGANNSKVRLTALSSSNVRIEVDANGDGSYEHTSTMTWAALLAA